MKELNVEEVKTIQLEILKYVADFCEQNRLRYWLDSGTLLGAVRHHGYIPWDDDIDIAMFREDYDRFAKLFNAAGSRYRFVSLETDPSFYCPFGKVFDTETVLCEPDENGHRSSINIDLFPHDNAPDSDALLRRQYQRRDRYKIFNGLRKACYRDHGNPIKKVILKTAFAVTHLFPETFFLRKMVKNAKKHAGDPTKRIGNFLDFSEHMVVEKKLIDPFVTVDFEGQSFYAPGDWDAYLTAIYGDYMRLPPEEQRVSHHAFKAWRL